MKVLILIFAVIALANCSIDPNYRTKKYIPKMPKLPTLIDAPIPVVPSIVGGTEATPHDWPWQVALYIDNLYFCGGSLISSEWVMTAAHCTTGSSSIIVQLGAHNISAVELTQVSEQSLEIITHEDYQASTIDNDIGLVRIAPVGFTSAIAEATLPSSSDADVGVGVSLTPTGWGVTSDALLAPISDVLRQVTVPSISNTECAAVYGTSVISPDKICTSGDGGMGTCSGDSGGPLNYPDGSGYVVRGIVSFGAAAGCTEGYPDAFTRVSHFRGWITTNSGV